MDNQSKKVLVITFLISIIAFIGIAISFGFNNTFRLKSDVSSYHNLSNYDHKLKVFNLNAYVNTLPSEIEKYDYLKVAFAIQGLVNREQPILYYIWEGSGFSYAGEPIMDNVWLADLKQQGLLLDGYTIEYINSFYDIIDIANDIGAIDGVVVWDNEVPSTSNVASTIAGVENLVPIRYDVSKQSCYTDLVENRKLLGTVKRDLVKKFRNISYLPDQNLNAMSSGTPSSGSSKNDAYLWAKKYYLDTGKTSKTVMGYTEDAWNTRCTTGACFMDASLPDTLQVNEEREITITVLNNNISSNETWTKSGNYRIAAANKGSNGFKITGAEYGFEQGNNVSQARIYLDSTNPIEAGERFKVKFTIKAPSTAGTYYLNLQVVHDGYGWFSGTIKQAITVSNSSTSANTKKTYYGSVPLSLFHSGLNTSDYLIKNKAFMFELSPDSTKKPIDDRTQPLGTDVNTFRSILSSQRTQSNGEIFNVVGFVPWFAKYSNSADSSSNMTAVQSEWAMVDIVSDYNGIIDADAANPIGITNASVFSHETLNPNLTQSNDKNAIKNGDVVKEIYDPNTQYFVLYMADYDGGSWVSGVYPSRFLMYGVNEARYPLAWPIAPDLSTRMPHAYNWLYAHQTPNDYFLFGDNGSGYLNPMRSPDLNKWKTHNIEARNRFDLDITGFIIAGNSGSLSNAVKNAYAEISPVLVGFQGNTPPTMSKVGNTPFIGALNADEARTNPNVSLGTDIYNQLNSTSNKFVIIRTVQFSRVQAYNAIDEVYAKASAAGKKVKVVDPYTFAQLYNDHPTTYKGCYTDGTNYQWVNGTTIPAGYSYTSKMTTEATCGVPRMKLPKPVMATPTMTYTGESMTPLVNNFDSTKMTLTGTHTATNIGTYTVTYSITDKNNYEWEDGSDTDITLTWSITKIKLEKPVMMTPEMEYSGNPMTPTVINFDYTKITLTGTHTATNIGDYTVSYAITDKANYEWDDGTDTDITLSWSIVKAKLSKPVMTTLSYPYTGSSITPIVANYNSDLLSTTGSYSATNIGDYTVTLIINDKTNYEWEDGTNADVSLNWEISKARLTKPTIDGTNSFTYNGETQGITVNGYDSNTMNQTGYISRINSGNYSSTYSLKDTNNYEWEDGTNADVSLNWKISKAKLTKPTVNGDSSFIYDGGYHGLTFDNVDLTKETITNNSYIDADSYTATISLNDTSNYSWNDGSTSALVFIWSITKANINPSVTINNYYENSSPSVPTITGNLGNGTVTYEYTPRGETSYSSTAPTTKGLYTLRATIASTTNYNGATASTYFEVLENTSGEIVVPEGSIITDVGLYADLIDSYNREKGTSYDYTHNFTEQELSSLKVLLLTNRKNNNVTVNSLSELNLLTSLESLVIDLWQNCSIDSLDLSSNTNLKKLSISNITPIEELDLRNNTSLKELYVFNSSIDVINIAGLNLNNIYLDKPTNTGYIKLRREKTVPYLSGTSPQDETIKDNSFQIVCNKYNLEVNESTTCTIKGKTIEQMTSFAFKLLQNNENVSISNIHINENLNGDYNFIIYGNIPIGEFDIATFTLTAVSKGTTKISLNDYSYENEIGYAGSSSTGDKIYYVCDEVSKVINIGKYSVTDINSNVVSSGKLQTNYKLKMVDSSGNYNTAYDVVVLGDVAADGIVNYRDVGKAYATITPPDYSYLTGAEIQALDYNCDKLKNGGDILEIYRALR